MNPENSELPRDLLIEEVREWRRSLLARYGNDLHRLGKALEQAQAEHPERLVDLRRHLPAADGTGAIERR